MSDDFVHDDEILYRRLPANRGLYKHRNDGTIEISSQAFTDRELRVSVDRAKLCGYNPGYTLDNQPGGVVSLLAKDVRNVDDLVRNDRGGNPILQFKIDVEPAPLPDNPAHAEICAIPPFQETDKKRAFHRLCQRLARLAETQEWAIRPDNQ